MILTDSLIKNHIDAGLIGVNPFEKTLINPSSLDFRLGNKYTFTRARSWNFYDKEGNVTCALMGSNMGSAACGYINPLDPDTFISETVEHEEYGLKPQESVLVSMFERLRLPANISGRVLGKSSLARLGLDNSSGAAWLDPGFEGYVTLELTNHSSNRLKLTHSMRIGQIIFYKHEPAINGYNKTGRYHNQKAGQPSLGII